MASDNPEDTVNRLVRVGEKHFAAAEREAAQDLIRDAFMMLPDELQEMYYDVVDLHHRRKFEESSNLFEKWMERARKLGLI